MTAPSPLSVQWLVVPSVRDMIFIFLFWSVLTGPLSNRPLADFDIGWHIRTGERILATHALPRTDPFSSTMQGQPWFAWEWLYDVLLGILHRACGLNGVVWLCAAVTAAFFAIVLSQLLRRGTGLPLAIVLMLLAEAAAVVHLYARPHIVSWLFSLGWFVVLERWEQGEGFSHLRPRWLPWFFPVSMLFWTNLHGGWLLGLALLGIYFFAAIFESIRGQDAFAGTLAAQRARGMAVAGIGAAVASLANPYGWRLHEHIYRYLSDRYLMNHIDEFRSPDFHGWAQRSFAIIVLLVLVAFVGRRGPGDGKRVRPSQTLVVLLAAYMGFYSSRNLPISAMLLVLIIGPLLWDNLAALPEQPGAWRWLRAATARIGDFSDRMGTLEMELRGHLWPVVTLALALAICLHGGKVGSRQLIHAEFDPVKAPVAAVDFLRREAEIQPQRNLEPVFSIDSWGGYLIYRMDPERKVAVDDRHDLYGSARVRQLLVLSQAEPGWQTVLQDWGVRTALLPIDSTLANLLQELPQDWQVVYEDKVAVVIERR